MPYDLSEYKKHFSLPERGAYLNCAAQGPLSRPATDAVIKALHDKEFPAAMDQAYGVNHVDRCREAVSKLISWPAPNIALANSTTWGINIVAQGLDLQSGDEVVVLEGQFPSNVAPWELLKEKGVELLKIPCPSQIASLEDFERNLTSKTKVASLEWVHFVSGDRIPLKEMTEICHKRGIVVVVDVTQGLGAIPFSMKDYGVDAVVCSAYKWLYSPYGTGFLALTDKLLRDLKPTYLNWLSLDGQWSDDIAKYNLNLCKTARRFDTSSQMGYLNLDGMTASVSWLATLDIENNFKAVRELIVGLVESMNPKFFKPLNSGSKDRQSLITTFKCSGIDGPKLNSALQSQGYFASIRCGCLRVATSIYNDSRQIDEFCKIANRVAAG